MNVGELRHLLERLPDDLLVTHQGRHAVCHIDLVARKAGRDAMVVLAGEVAHEAPPPPVAVNGRWPAERRVVAAVDPARTQRELIKMLRES